MRLYIISILTIIFISLSDILFCNERKDTAGRAPLYRSEFVLGVLFMSRIIQFLLIIILGILNWKALIIVIIVSILGIRLFIDKLVETVILIPIIKVLLFIFGSFKGKQDKV